MSIQSTITIRRSDAIERIRDVALWIVEHDYASIESNSSEHDLGVDHLRKLVADGVEHLDIEHLDGWSNSMLGGQMSRPYYRQSMFENYQVVNDEDYKESC